MDQHNKMSIYVNKINKKKLFQLMVLLAQLLLMIKKFGFVKNFMIKTRCLSVYNGRKGTVLFLQ